MRNFLILLAPIFFLFGASNTSAELFNVASLPIASRATEYATSSSHSPQKDNKASYLDEAVREIDKQNRNYQNKPRKTYVSTRATQPSVAVYMDDWRSRIEKVGAIAYPTDAYGKKIYGQLRVTIEIATDGRLIYAGITESSGNPELDKAALRILNMASPMFKKLPPDMLDAEGKPSQILVINKKMTFENPNRVASTTTEAQ